MLRCEMIQSAASVNTEHCHATLDRFQNVLISRVDIKQENKDLVEKYSNYYFSCWNSKKHDLPLSLADLLFFIGKDFVSVFIEIKFIIISSSLINRVKVI